MYEDEEIKLPEGEVIFNLDNEKSGKGWFVTVILCAFTGVFGGHRFYTSHVQTAKIQLCLGIFSTILLLLFPDPIFLSDSNMSADLGKFVFGTRLLLLWVAIDFILICLGRWKDKSGNELVGYNFGNGILSICVFAILVMFGVKIYNTNILNATNQKKSCNHFKVQTNDSFKKPYKNKYDNTAVKYKNTSDSDSFNKSYENKNDNIVDRHKSNPNTNANINTNFYTSRNSYTENKKLPEKVNTVNRAGNVDFSNYMYTMSKKIKANWHPPKGKETKKVVVFFNIDRSGKLNSAKIKESSGVEELDKSAIKALEDASPFEKLPDEYTKENIDVQFTFDYKVHGAYK